MWLLTRRSRDVFDALYFALRGVVEELVLPYYVAERIAKLVAVGHEAYSLSLLCLTGLPAKRYTFVAVRIRQML